MFISGFEANSYWPYFFKALILNLYITGIFAFAVFAFPSQKLLPKSYYLIRNSTKLKRIFKILKVDWFRNFLLATFWKSEKQRNKYFDGTASGLDHLEIQSMKSEFGHLIPFIIILAVSFWLIAIGQSVLGIFCILINVFFNFYPVVLQRHHRMRIALLRKIQQHRSTSRN